MALVPISRLLLSASLHHGSLKSTLILPFCLWSGFPRSLYSSGFLSKIFISILLLVHATCHTFLRSLVFIPLTTSYLRRSSVCNFLCPSVTSSPLSPYVLLGTLFSNSRYQSVFFSENEKPELLESFLQVMSESGTLMILFRWLFDNQLQWPFVFYANKT